MYLDSKGLIVQSSGDGGDTLQREGFWYEGAFLNSAYQNPQNMASYAEALWILDTSKGFVRSWQVPYNDPTDTSRDQLVSNIRAMGYNQYKRNNLDRILYDAIKNWSRFPNGDIVFINDYGRFIRAYKAWYISPILYFLDLPMLVNSLIICFWLTRTPGIVRVWLAAKFPSLFWLTHQYPPNSQGVPQSPYCPENTSNDINFIGDLAQAQRIYPTVASYLAQKIYKLFRPKGPQYALDTYFSAGSGGNPEFAALWAPIVSMF
jgi:hypothetical protein